MDNDMLKQILRTEREFVFRVINRGKLWYDSLTNEQLLELSEWYNKWLKVTETLERPQRPTWLK